MKGMKQRFVTAPDGSTIYVTIDGDMVDHIAFAFYGAHAANTELVYDANPGLAAKGLLLPAGETIRLPPAPPPSPTPRAFRRLWE